MGRNLSPLLKQELENLDKDAESRKSAMKAIKSYVKDLDSKTIPMFLAQVSETNGTGLTSGEYAISLYEVLARVHGTKIVPQIDNIMSIIIKTLTSSVASFALHQACSKVVPAIARYGMDPTTPDDKKRQIIHSLCKPLSGSLLSEQENLSAGAALCLKALVDSDNWRFASSQTVNEVCQRVVGALDKPMMTSSHMGLVMSLAKHNGLVVEAYARLLVLCGIKILNLSASEGISQKRLMAIQMIHFLMRSLDYKCIISELSFIIEEMKKCDDDHMAYVKGAAFEATQTARRILIEKGSKYENRSGQRGLSATQESQTVGSFDGYSSVVNSPYSNGFSEDQGNYANGCSGFLQKSASRCHTPTPQRPGSCINHNDVKIFTTPTKLVMSLQASNEVHSDFSSNQSERVKSPQSQSSITTLLCKFSLNRTPKHDQNGFSCDRGDSFTHDDEQFYDTSESVSSAEDICQEFVTKMKGIFRFSGRGIVCGLNFLFAIIVCFLLVGETNEGHSVVPT